MPISAAGECSSHQHFRPSQCSGKTVLPSPVTLRLFVVSQSERPGKLVSPVHETGIQCVDFTNRFSAWPLERLCLAQRSETVGPIFRDFPGINFVSKITIQNVIRPDRAPHCSVVRIDPRNSSD